MKKIIHFIRTLIEKATKPRVDPEKEKIKKIMKVASRGIIRIK